MQAIKEYPDYKISRDGYVYNKDGERLRGVKNKDGLIYVTLTGDKKTAFSVYKLVARAYLPEGKYDIEGMKLIHKDSNRSNNDVNNLEWVPDRDRTKERVVIRNIDLRETDFVKKELIDRWLKDGDIKTISDAPNYYIHKLGFVINKDTLRIMKTRYDDKGYKRIGLTTLSRGKKTILGVHRLVAKAFVKGWVVGKNVVNHLDGKKDNNVYTNLEWTDDAGNARHAVVNGLKSNNKFVTITDLKENETFTLPSIAELSKYLKLGNTTVLSRIRNSPKHPILKRYVVKIDEDRFLNGGHDMDRTSNIILNIYIYDHVNDEYIVLNTKPKVIYYTGISEKFIDELVKHKQNRYKAGYSLSVNGRYIEDDITKEQAIEDRVKYHSTPILVPCVGLIVLDTTTGAVKEFNSTKEIYDNLNTGMTNVMSITTTITRGRQRGRPGVFGRYACKRKCDDNLEFKSVIWYEVLSAYYGARRKGDGTIDSSYIRKFNEEFGLNITDGFKSIV